MGFYLLEPGELLFVELGAKVNLEFRQDDWNLIEIDVEMELGN